MKHLNTKILFSVMLALAVGLPVQAQHSKKFSIRPTGRFVLDYSTFSTKNVELRSGVGVRDVRMGFKASYGKYALKGDISFTGLKVSMKDIYAQRYFKDKKSFLRVGHYCVPFGLHAVYSSLHKPFMHDISANSFQIGRRLGIMYSVWNKNLWVAAGAFADKSALNTPTNLSGHQGYILGERFVYRPINASGKLLQLGFSTNYINAESAGLGKERMAHYKAPYYSIVDKTNAAEAKISNAKCEWRYTAELAAIYKNFALEAQYYGANVQRQSTLPNFNGNGFYTTVKCLAIHPTNYDYSDEYAGFGKLKEGQMEVALGYSLLNLNDDKAQIFGGKMQDVSLGLSYNLTPNLKVRGDYSYITVQHPNMATAKANVIQCRVQYYF